MAYKQRTVTKQTQPDVRDKTKTVETFNLGAEEEKRGTCPPVKVTISNADYADSGLQAARAATRTAAEEAKKRLIEAQAKVDEARILSKAARDENYMELKRIEAQVQMATACAANPNCTLIIGADGAIVGTK